MTVLRRFGHFVLPGAVAVLVAGCARSDTATPVATVSFTPSRTAVPLGSPIDLKYRFEVAADAKITGDYRVFVHLNRDDGTTVWTDDHDLIGDLATSKWKPGQVVEYTRTRFVPLLSYLGRATVQIGLYRDEERLPLGVPNASERELRTREYTVGTIDLLAQAESILLIRKSGWHPNEYDASDPTLEWQWTQKVATLGLRNPRRDATFYLEVNSRPDVFPDGPQQVRVSVGDVVVATISVDSIGPALHRIPLSADALGNADMVELRLEVDRTFVPSALPGGGRDNRELGVRVYHAYVEPK